MGWLEDKAEAEAAKKPACPVCGVAGTSPCVTKAGKVAKKNHKERG